MTAIIIPRRHITQPQGRVTVEPEWVQRKPVAVWTPASPGYDAAGGGVYPYSGSTVRPSEIGLAYQHTARVLPGAAFPRINGQLPLTILAYCNPTTTRASIYTQRVAVGNNELSFRVNEAAANNISFWNFPGVGTWLHGAGVLDGRYQMLAATFDGAEDRIYADGEVLNSRSATSGAAPSTVAIGGLPDSTSIPYARGLGLLATFQSALSADEITELSINPWQLFRADPIRIYSFPSGPIIPYISSVTMSNVSQNSAKTNIQLTF